MPVNWTSWEIWIRILQNFVIFFRIWFQNFIFKIEKLIFPSRFRLISRRNYFSFCSKFGNLFQKLDKSMRIQANVSWKCALIGRKKAFLSHSELSEKNYLSRRAWSTRAIIRIPIGKNVCWFYFSRAILQILISFLEIVSFSTCGKNIYFQNSMENLGFKFSRK